MTLAASQASLINRRVLIVEDEYFIADDIAQVLEQAGAEVVGPALTRETALALLTSERIDIAVLDIELHGELVFSVADFLRARAIPFIFATGYSQAFLPAQYRDIATWEKPFDVYALALALANLTGDVAQSGVDRVGPDPAPAALTTDQRAIRSSHQTKEAGPRASDDYTAEYPAALR
jgi:CheY-like chemotaxis protein